MIAGEASSDRAHFSSSMNVLVTGLLPCFGIQHLAMSGHPESHPDMDETEADEALRRKASCAEARGLLLRNVTQFGFGPDRTLAWAAGLAAKGSTRRCITAWRDQRVSPRSRITQCPAVCRMRQRSCAIEDSPYLERL